MTDPVNSDAALAANILDILDREYREGPQWNDAEMRSMASALAAAAERADEAERRAKEHEGRSSFQSHRNVLRRAEAAEAALLAAQQERDGLQHTIDCANTPLMRDVLNDLRATEATNTRLRELAALIIEYEPGTKGPTLEYIKERARAALADTETKE